MMEEFSVRAGEGTPYAATLTAIPHDDDTAIVWFGTIRFDDDVYNLPVEMRNYDGITCYVYEDWCYYEELSGGTHLMNMLNNWHGKFVAMFERVKERVR